MELWQTESGKVRLGERNVKCGTLSETPRAVGTAGGLGRQSIIQPEPYERGEAPGSMLPLLPHQTA